MRGLCLLGSLLCGCHLLLPHAPSGDARPDRQQSDTLAEKPPRDADRWDRSNAESSLDAPPCDDGLPCTTDTRTALGCVATLSPGFCVIEGACVPAGPSATKTCHACDPAFATRSWAPASGCLVTIAGNGNNTVTDGPALSAAVSWPSGIVVRTDGSLLTCDRDGHTIRLIAEGVVSIWAGCS
jgi:hypothetical protein